jgi:hypothetical protein
MAPNDADAALQNWARWARDDDPRLGYGEPPIFAQWLPRNDWDYDGWGAPPSSVEAVPLPIDELAAMRTDGLLMALRVRHWHCLRRHYLHRAAQPWDRLQPALRAFADVHDAKESSSKKKGWPPPVRWLLPR